MVRPREDFHPASPRRSDSEVSEDESTISPLCGPRDLKIT